MPQAPTDIDTSAILGQNLECCMQHVARNKLASKCMMDFTS